MLDLMRFELKKMLCRRVSLYACIGVVVLLCVLMSLNVLQTTTSCGTTYLRGMEAITYDKETAAKHAGELTPERVQGDLDAYYDLACSEIDPEDLRDLSDAAAYSIAVETYDEQALEVLFDSYYTFVLSPWSVPRQEPYQTVANLAPNEASEFYKALDERFQAKLEGVSPWTYGEAEKAFWSSKQVEVSYPLSYGYFGGWENILDCLGFLAFAMIAICVTLVPVFSSEYTDGTDALILATRHGRGKLAFAKISASLLFSTVYFLICAGIICAASFMAFGAGGYNLPVQVLSLMSPYNLTMLQAVVIGLALSYVITLGFASLTLALSSKIKSVLTIFAVDVALILVTGLMPTMGSDLIAHIFALFPFYSLNASVLFVSGVSYAVGPIVLDILTVLALVYGVITIACIPFAASSFRRHQVA
ncbi:MAG: ABC transporter permease [Eggerthellaceae bacterium]|nr:ABC transporter permease [Eggerthellaceae bacterium]